MRNKMVRTLAACAGSACAGSPTVSITVAAGSPTYVAHYTYARSADFSFLPVLGR